MQKQTPKNKQDEQLNLKYCNHHHDKICKHSTNNMQFGYLIAHAQTPMKTSSKNIAAQMANIATDRWH